MISKGHHYVINIGIASNFYIKIDPVYLGSCPRGSIIMPEFRGILAFPSPYILKPTIHGEFWEGIIRKISINYLCFFLPSLSILSILQLKSAIRIIQIILQLVLFCFHFPVVHVMLQSFKEIPTSQPFRSAMLWRGINTEISAIKGVSSFFNYREIFYWRVPTNIPKNEFLIITIFHLLL